MFKSKMVIVMYPRKRKMVKEQLIMQTAITAIMSLMSVGGKIESAVTPGGLELIFPMSDNPEKPGIPQNWFTGDSHFRVEVVRITNDADYQALYHWCKESSIPVFRGEEDGAATMMVIGPSWENRIDEMFTRAVPLHGTVRVFASKKKEEKL